MGIHTLHQLLVISALAQGFGPGESSIEPTKIKDFKGQFQLRHGGIMFIQYHIDPGQLIVIVLRYFQAAEQGLSGAQRSLGVMYARGDGVPQGFVFAHMWLSLAVARIPPGVTRDEVTNFRDGIAKYMTPAEVAEAQRFAKQWKPK